MSKVPPLDQNRIRDYWAKVDRRGPEDCWMWTGATGSHGYGVLGFAGRPVQPKHIALILDGRPRPPAPGDHALHGPCSDRRCVNPAHLRWGDNSANVADMVALGRQAKGAMLGRSMLTDDDVREIKRSGESQRVLAARYHVSQSNISRIKTGEQWNHVTT